MVVKMFTVWLECHRLYSNSRCTLLLRATQIRWYLKETNLSGPRFGGQTDGFLCCQYCLRLLDKIHQDSMAIRFYLAEIRSITALGNSCPQLTHQTSLQVVTKPENHSLLRKEKRNALTMPEECFLKLFHYALVPLHCDQLATLPSLHFFVSKTKQAGQSREPSLMNFLSSFKS